jgi:hypothetical protein
MAHQKIQMPKIGPAQRIEFDFEGSASLAKHMDRRTTSFLCTIEWSWSPANYRMESYYLQRRRTHWVLWLKHHGDVEEWYPKPIAIARCQRGEGFAQDYKAAAMILLAAVLTEEIRQSNSELDRFHAITDAGLLSIQDPQSRFVASRVVAHTFGGAFAPLLFDPDAQGRHRSPPPQDRGAALNGRSLWLCSNMVGTHSAAASATTPEPS